MCLVLHAPNDLRLDERDAGPMAPNQVLVKVAMGGICGSDLHWFAEAGIGDAQLERRSKLAAGCVQERQPALDRAADRRAAGRNAVFICHALHLTVGRDSQTSSD